MNEIEVNETKPGLMDKVGSGLSNVMKNSELVEQLMPMLLVCLPPPFDILALVALQCLTAIMGPDEDPEKLGYQMNMSDKGPEDESFHGSFSEFKNYLDDKFPFDAENFAQMSPDEKLACGYVGAVGAMAELNEKSGTGISPETLGTLSRGAANLGFDQKTFGSFFQGMGADSRNLEALASVAMAANGNLDPGKYEDTMQFLNARMQATGTGKTAEDFIEAASVNG